MLPRARRLAITLLGAVPALATSARANGPEAGEADSGEPSDDELRKEIENPLADLVTVPFQNNLNYNIGPFNRSSNVLNIQPFIPIHVNERWNIITRTVVPFVYQPDVDNVGGGSSGLGDSTETLFLTPTRPGPVIWGFGPVTLLPTATQVAIGGGKWGFGPAAITEVQTDRWTVGIFLFNIWSVGGVESRPAIEQLTLQYFVNYNLPESWYLVTSPIMTADWRAPGSGAFLPVGGGIGRIFRVGPARLNGVVQGFYNVVTPEGTSSPTWTLRAQINFIFPKARRNRPAGEVACAPAGPR
jgi:hypothetical protein